jgi:hypothetical protein
MDDFHSRRASNEARYSTRAAARGAPVQTPHLQINTTKETFQQSVAVTLAAELRTKHAQHFEEDPHNAKRTV